METVINFYIYLIIAFLGLLMPLIALLLSLFTEGFQKVADQYENEKAQTEKNIKSQLEKIASSDKLDTKAIHSNLKKLEKINLTVKIKLFYLNPKHQIINFGLSLIISFIFAIFYFILPVIWSYLSIGISIFILLYALSTLWVLVVIFSEVQASIDIDKSTAIKEIATLLSRLIETVKASGSKFLERIFLGINNIKIDSSKKIIPLESDKQLNLSISIYNDEEVMAKNVEVGLTFPLDFIIEKKPNYNIFRNEGKQIVRYNLDDLQGKTTKFCSELILTPLKKGEYAISTFVKGENIKTTYKIVLLEVN